MSELLEPGEQVVWESKGKFISREIEQHSETINRIIRSWMQIYGLPLKKSSQISRDRTEQICDNIVGQIFILTSHDDIERTFIKLSLNLGDKYSRLLKQKYIDPGKNLALLVVKVLFLRVVS